MTAQQKLTTKQYKWTQSPSALHEIFSVFCPKLWWFNLVFNAFSVWFNTDTMNIPFNCSDDLTSRETTRRRERKRVRERQRGEWTRKRPPGSFVFHALLLFCNSEQQVSVFYFVLCCSKPFFSCPHSLIHTSAI